MGSWPFVLCALGAAAAFAVSTHLKHLSSSEVPSAQSLRRGAVGRLIRATLSHRLWLAGIGADTVGLVLQILALHLGPLAVVQPLLILGLPLALVLRHSRREGLRASELGWSLVVVLALASLVALANTSNSVTSSADHGPALTAAALGSGLAVAAVLAARRQRSGDHSALLFGVAVGVIYATTAALMKVASDIWVRAGITLLAHWQLYVIIVLGAAGLVLNQVAFQAGRLTASLPAISAIDPLLSVVIGVWVFDERLRSSPAADVGLVALFFVLILAVIKLARSDQLDAAT